MPSSIPSEGEPNAMVSGYLTVPLVILVRNLVSNVLLYAPSVPGYDV